MKNFKDDEIYFVNVLGKPLPFKGKFKYTSTTDDIQTIMAGLSKMPTKTAVIDDFGYIMTNLFMAGHGGGDQFKLYNLIADTVWSFINFVRSSAVPEDAIVYMVLHEDINDDGTNKLRTIGKLLDQKVCIEGMATVVLRSTVKGDRHVFVTQSDGNSIAKSPEGMFPTLEIDNDLAAVDDAIRAYWDVAPRTTTKKGEKTK